MSWCEKCGDYVWTECRCKPWEVFVADVKFDGSIRGFESKRIVHAIDAGDAAEKYIEHAFNDSGSETTGALVLVDGAFYDCEANPTVEFKSNKSRMTVTPELLAAASKTE